MKIVKKQRILHCESCGWFTPPFAADGPGVDKAFCPQCRGALKKTDFDPTSESRTVVEIIRRAQQRARDREKNWI